MADVFVSYSRRDAAFVSVLVEDLQDHGKSVWVDTDGIGDGEVFPDVIRAAIEGSDVFVFVITPDSAASRFCESEVDHALELNKRVVPVLRQAVDDDLLPEAIRVRHWIPYLPDADAAAATDRLIAALDTDLEHMRAHTRWLVKALDWESHGRDKSFLLQGSELASAEAWLASVGDNAEPSPTALQREYLYAGRAASSRRQRRLVGGSLIVAAASIALVIFAAFSRSQAVTAKNDAEAARANAQSRALAAESEGQLSVDPERSILLAMEAVRADETPEAVFALQHAIDTSPIRGRLPNVGPQPQGLIGWGPGIAYSPDGTQIAEGSQTGTVVLLNAADLKVERSIDVGAFAAEVAYSPDGSRLAVGSDLGLVLYDPRTGEEVGNVHVEGPASGLQFSRDGSLLSATTYEPDTFAAHVQVWDTASRQLREIPVGSSIKGPYDYGLTFGGAFSPDGRRMLVTGQNGLGVFDVATGRMFGKALGGLSVNQAEYSPDGSMILAAYNPLRSGASGHTEVQLLGARTLHPLETIFRPTDGVANSAYQARFSPDGGRVAFVLDRTFGVYSLATHTLVLQRDLGAGGLHQIAFSPDGEELAVTAGDGSGAVYRAGGPEQMTIDPGSFNPQLEETPLALTGDGVTLALSPQTGPNAGKEVVRTWSLDGVSTSRPLVVSDGTCPYFGVDPTGAQAYVAPAPCGSYSYLTSKAVPIWDVGERRVATTLRIGGVAAGLPAFSGDGSTFATLVATSLSTEDTNTTIDLVDLATKTTTPLPLESSCGAWPPTLDHDGTVLASMTCDDIDVWRFADGEPVLHTFPVSISANAGPIVLAPDGRTLAIANATGASDVAIVDATTGDEVTTLAGHTQRVRSIAFSPDGSLLATASVDGSAKVWDATTGQLLRTLDHPGPVRTVVFSTDGTSIATMDWGGIIRIWDACSECRDPGALMALAQTRVTRELTPDERRTFLG